MKRSLVLILLFLSPFFAKAQSGNYHAFKLDFDFGYANPSYNNTDVTGGFSFTIEPHYFLSNRFALGLRLEGVITGYSSPTYSGADLSGISSYCLSGNYYLSSGKVKPFIGLAAGAFMQSATQLVSFGGKAVSTPTLNEFGVVPSIGIEVRHFRLSAEYDIVGGDVSYMAVKAGFFIGGGGKR